MTWYEVFVSILLRTNFGS